MNRLRAALLAGVVGLAAAPAVAQSFDPGYRFQILNTPHFTIHFHQGESAEGARLAQIAEETWQAVQELLPASPPTHTDVILVDQAEDANGWASPTPRNTVMITAAWPDAAEFIGSTDDWLRLVFTHEFTHVAHLDRSRGWAAAVRAVFGQVPLAFPNTWLSAWQIEGLATFEESAVSHEGRLHAGDFRAIVDEAARTHRLEPLDRVNGGLTAWPSGLAAYAYGLAFHAYLADRFGSAVFAQLSDATAGALPYLWTRQFERVFGRSLGTLWREFEGSLEEAASQPDAKARQAAAEADALTRLTQSGFITTAPRIVPARCGTCAPGVVYALRGPDDFPGLFEIPLDGGGAPARLADRYLGTSTAADRDRLYFDQQERRRNAGTYSDLYVLTRTTGTVRRLTRDARLVDPDVSPDGRRLVAVRHEAGQRVLVTIDVPDDASNGRARWRDLVREPDTQFNAPRWSPDGRYVAVERQRRGHYPEIVVVDTASHDVHVLAATPGVRWVTPAWRPDGAAIVAAADLHEGPFNLYEIPLDGSDVRQLTHTLGGATRPDVSPDGRAIVFAGYTVDGFDIFRVAYRPAENRTAEVRPTTGAEPAAVEPAGAAPSLPARSYTPWRTITPTAWSPVWETSSQRTRVGAQVSGADILGYHAWALTAAWIASQPARTPLARATRPDLSASYAYTRWTISPWIAVSRGTSFFGVAPSDVGFPIAATVLERQVEAGVTLPVLHVRRAQSTQVSFVRSVADLELAGQTATRRRAAFRGAWAMQTAKVFGYSISPERGVAVGVTGEWVRRALGADANAQVATGDLRVYLPGLARHHVVAVRAAGGVSRGSVYTGRTFLLGGGAAAAGVSSFSSEAFGLLRGFAADSFAGARVAVANVDYRLPIWRLERGSGTLPFFLHTVHAAIFFDAGHAWTRPFSLGDVKTDVGGEVSADLVVGYWLPLTVSAGAARGHDGSGLVPDGWRAFARVGHAF